MIMQNLENTETEVQILNIDIEEQKTMSLKRFIFLSILSFGLYPIWWIFEAWRFFMQKDKLDIMPAMRTILAYFFIYSLFNKIQTYAERQGYSHKNSPLMMCIGFIVSSLLSSLPDPYWLISLFNFVFLIPAFQALNYAKLNSQGFHTVQMKKFSLPQKLLIAFGIVFWILILMALFILETPQ